ncbi:unnamed protein product [Ectocarpus fasciculatus]
MGEAGDGPECRPCRILILGDGNFSFSLALAKALLLPATPHQQPSPQARLRQQAFKIVATSFDGRLDLLSKYVEAPGIVAALRSLGVMVLHNVDATALDSRVVQVSPSDRRHTQRQQQQQQQQFEHVIFNHPHTGTEDMRRHRSFLGHFFHAVANAAIDSTCPVSGGGGSGGGEEGCGVSDSGGGGALAAVPGMADRHGGTGAILAPGGAVHVTLALDQPERWGLEEQAARHGFSLVHRRRFPAEKIDGYMTKRHQTGRSFRQRVQASETLSFSWAARTQAAQGGRAAVGSTLPPWLWPEVNMCGDEALPARAETATGEPVRAGGSDDGNAPTPAVDDNVRKRSGDRTGGGCTDKTGAAAADALLPEVCELCGKRYKSAQALRTHTRQFHELGQEGGVAVAPKKEERCPHPNCGRVFTSDRALEQHVAAKHRGDNVDIKPDWFVGSIYHLEPPPPPPPVPTDGDVVVERGRNGRMSAANAAGSDERCRGTAEAAGATTPDVVESPPGVFGVPERKVPATAAVCTDVEVGSSLCQRCDVCGYWFTSPEDLQQHLDNLRPPIEGAVTRYDCGTCAKDFGSRRALLQHAKFCSGGGRAADRVVMA